MALHDSHRPNLNGVSTRLGALESQVMEILWESDLLSVRDIINQIPANPAYTTIATVLTNLRKKALVCTTKEGHATKYRACLSREQHTTRLIEQALDESGDRQASMMHFVQGMPEEDLRLLRKFLSTDHPDSP